MSLCVLECILESPTGREFRWIADLISIMSVRVSIFRFYRELILRIKISSIVSTENVLIENKVDIIVLKF